MGYASCTILPHVHYSLLLLRQSSHLPLTRTRRPVTAVLYTDFSRTFASQTPSSSTSTPIMPPKKSSGATSKKATASAGRQSLLGMFFALPAGTKPPTMQQTKLKVPKERPLSSDEEEDSAADTAAEKEVVERMEDVKVEEKDDDEVMADVSSTLDPKPSPKETEEVTKMSAKVNESKKRARTPEEKEEKSDEEPSVKESEAEEAEDEPVTKRGRKSKDESVKTAKKKTTESALPRELKEESESEKPKSTKKANETSEEPELPKRPKKTTADKVSKSSAKPKKETAAKKPAAKKAKAVVKDEAEDAGEAEKTSASESEGATEAKEKPAINAKARKKVQATLTKGNEHPHPDWAEGASIPYAALVKTFNLIEGTTKRLEKILHTSLFLRQVLRLSPDELILVVHLMINRLAAEYEGVELGIGESLLMKAICESCGRSMQKLKEDQKQIGDLGEVAMKSRGAQRTLFQPKPLTIKSVHEGFKEIATIKGEGGQGRKVDGIKKLLSSAKGDEAKYIVRALEGKLRLGQAERVAIVALSQAVIMHEHEKAGKKAPSTEQMAAAEEVLKSVYSELPNYDIIIAEMLKGGIMNLKDTCKLQPGVPLKPMLAKPTKSITEVLDRFENRRFTCEYKYDGERVQLHYVAPNSTETYAAVDNKKGISKIFSRNSEELSPKYPDILAALGSWVKPGIQSFVMDCEAVAWDKDEKRVLPFQQLMTRKRKDVAIKDVKVKVFVFGFDLLFLNGKSQVATTLEARRALMHSSFQPTEGEFAFATATDGQELDTIQTFLDESIKASCEGLMVKAIDGEESYYEPSKRSVNWLKVKKDYLAGAGDSLDLVVLGGYHGKGKRTNVYGAFLLAVYNPDSQEFESICNIGTGFSEDVLKKLHTQLRTLEIDKPKPYYSHTSSNVDQPDVWFEPQVVWEVKTADISLSPKYMAGKGLVDAAKGISLRFPRYIRDREDKKPEQATTGYQLSEMYRRQDVVMNNSKSKSRFGGGGGGGVDDDFEY